MAEKDSLPVKEPVSPRLGIRVDSAHSADKSIVLVTPKRLLIALLMIAVYGWFFLAENPSEGRLEAYKSATVYRGDMKPKVSATGVMAPKKVWLIAAKSEALVSRLPERIGALVNRRATLVVLENKALELEVLRAAMELSRAETYLERVKAEWQSRILELQGEIEALRVDAYEARRKAEADEKLRKRGYVSQYQTESPTERAKAIEQQFQYGLDRLEKMELIARNQAKAELELVENLRAVYDYHRTQKDALSVVANRRGIVSDIFVKEGQWVEAGDPLLEIASADNFVAVLDVPEASSRGIEVGQQAVVKFGAEEKKARVSNVNPTVKNGYISVELSIEEVLPSDIRIGRHIEGIIALDDLENVLMVTAPVAVQKNRVGSVFRISGDKSVAEKVYVTFGCTDEGHIQIIDGLQENDEIIVSDTGRWADTDKILLR